MQHTNKHVQSHLIYFRYGILPASHSGEEIGLPRIRKMLQEIRLQQKTKLNIDSERVNNKHKRKKEIYGKQECIHTRFVHFAYWHTVSSYYVCIANV